MRTITLHSFCSVKGGVGKSTLAVATGALLSAAGRVPVIIDGDLLGVSLADGLMLLAPKVALQNRRLDLTAGPSGAWYSHSETRSLRYARKAWLQEHSWWQDGDEEQPPPPAFLNDALFFPVPDWPAEDCSVAALLWRHEQDDGVAYLPSSPLRLDVERCVRFLAGFGAIRRVAWLLDRLLWERPDVTDVVLDLPPGTWGFSHEAMVFVGALCRSKPLPDGYPDWSHSIRWQLNPFIVTSSDRIDYVLAIDYFLEARTLIPELKLVANRTIEGVEQLKRRMEGHLIAPLRGIGVVDGLRHVPALPQTLGRVFVDGDLSASKLSEQGQRVLYEALNLLDVS